MRDTKKCFNLDGLWLALIFLIIIVGSQATNITKAFVDCKCEVLEQGSVE